MLDHTWTVALTSEDVTMTYTYSIFRLRLPSGGVVRVRKPGTIGLLGRAPSLLPLLAAAAAVSRPSDTETTQSEVTPRTVLDVLKDVAHAVLLDTTLVDALLWADLLTLHAWALSTRHEPAVLESEAAWSATDLKPLITGAGAILLDRVAQRYGQRPSSYLGLDPLSALAADCDFAVGYRGLRYDNAGADEEVEAEIGDGSGRTMRVPRSALATADAPRGAKVINPDWYVDHYGPNLNFTAGGEGGDGLMHIGKA